MDQPYTHIEAPYSEKAQFWELLVFLFLIVPSMGISFFLVHRGDMGFVLVATATIFRDLALVGLVAFFLWRNGEQAGLIGWKFENHWRDALWGAVLFLPVSICDRFARAFTVPHRFEPAFHPLPSFLSAHGLAEVVLATVLVTVVAISEETIFRGYLILRLSAVTHSTVAAVLLSSVIFSLGHGYEGSAGAVASVLWALFLQSAISGGAVCSRLWSCISSRTSSGSLWRPAPSPMSRKVVSRVACRVSLELAAATPWGSVGRICGVAASKRPFLHQHFSFAYGVRRMAGGAEPLTLTCASPILDFWHSTRASFRLRLFRQRVVRRNESAAALARDSGANP